MSADVRPCTSDALAASADDRVRQAVATVDAMPSRGRADELIDPLRSRLAGIRPSRSLNLTRLLFIPLDPIIVAPGAWRPSQVGVPRSALAVLAQALRRDSQELRAFDDSLRDATTADPEQVVVLGTPIWAVAGPRLLASCPPETWASATGLTAADHASLVRTLALVLSEAPALLRLAGLASTALDGEVARLCDAGFAASMRFKPASTAPDPAPLASFVAVLMLRSPRPDRALAAQEALEDARAAARAASGLALDFVLDDVCGSAAAHTLGQAARQTARAAAMLEDLESRTDAGAAARERLALVRAHLDTSCRARFSAAITELLAPAETAMPGRSHTLAASREALAREARRFARFARRIGSGRAYDEALRLGAAKFTEPCDDRSIAAERARLATILAGAEDATDDPS